MTIPRVFVGSVVLLATACSFDAAPTLDQVSVDFAPNETTPLAARVVLTASEPVTVRFLVEAGDDAWVIDPETVSTESHELPLLGLRPGALHEVRVEVQDQAGNATTSEVFSHRTAPLPAELPAIVVEYADPDAMEPGLTLFSVMRWPESGMDGVFGVVFAINPLGDVAWYYRPDHAVTDLRMLANGNLLYQSARMGYAYEVDMMGNVVDRWHTTGAPKEAPEGSTPVETDSFHHEIVEMPSGNLLSLSAEYVDDPAYPSNALDSNTRRPASVVGDVIVEFERSGAILHEYSLLDILDPHRAGSGGFIEGGWNAVYPDAAWPLIDWSHGNAVVYDSYSDAFLVSVRDQDAIVKVDRASGELVWIFGQHRDWAAPWQEYLLDPVGNFEWHNYQHAPQVTGDDRILLFDNGTHRNGRGASPQPDDEKYSRAVEYMIDEEAMSVRQVWSYGGPGEDRFYSAILGDADLMPTTGNVLITSGGELLDGAGSVTGSRQGDRTSRIFEVTRDDPSQIVFTVRVLPTNPGDGWHTYRAERIRDLYRALR